MTVHDRDDQSEFGFDRIQYGVREYFRQLPPDAIFDFTSGKRRFPDVADGQFNGIGKPAAQPSLLW